MKFLSLAIAGCLAFSVCCAPININNNISKPVKNSVDVYRSVGMVSVYTKDDRGALIGTAFPINSDEFLTAGHVCFGILQGQSIGALKKNIVITLLDSKDHRYIIDGWKIKKVSEDFDLCILEKKHHGVVPLKLSDDYKNLRIGDDVQIYGSPIGVAFVQTVGKIVSFDGSKMVPYYFRKGLLVVAGAAFGGNSGGPIIKDGKVIGVLIAGFVEYPIINFSTDVEAIQVFLRQ